MTKKVLITGEDSYIGRSFIEYCQANNEDFEIDELDVRGEQWKEFDFSSYDSVFHVAGIAHIKETKKNKYLYYKINRDLTINIAKKAKESGVRQFVFMSTMSVFGRNKSEITLDTNLVPKTVYGKSKLEGEEGLNRLANNIFKVSIIRPPMVYGKNSKGNYLRLANLARKTPIFLKVKNKRSMIFIDNLSELIKLVIKYQQDGIFHPQNKELVQTSNMVKLISEIHNHKIFFINMNILPKFLIKNNSIFSKVFGDLYYSPSISKLENMHYQIINFKESIERTEIRNE